MPKVDLVNGPIKNILSALDSIDLYSLEHWVKRLKVDISEMENAIQRAKEKEYALKVLLKIEDADS